MSSNRVIIIGLDGVPYSLIKDLSESGIMPNTKKILEHGVFKKMQSSIPEVSSVAWSSIITGVNPAEHGIFGFTDLFPKSYNMIFPNFNDLKKPPFWTEIKGKSIIINVPATYPVREMNGVHISGFISVDIEKSVYPKSLIPKLRELDYRLDIDCEVAHKSMQLFLSELDKTLKACIKTHRYLWNQQNWQLFMFVFTSTDRLMHFLWDAYEDKNHSLHYDFLNHFHQIDEVIGDMLDKVDETDLFVMLSDHGFEQLNKDIYINYLLKKGDFLKLQDIPDATWNNIDYSTQAFALDPARIYINLKDKYPRGSVSQKDKKKVIEDLEDLFSSLKIDNRRVIRNIYRKEDIYSGSFLEAAPDLVLIANRGFNLKADIKANKLFDKGIFTGKHNYDDAFLLINRNFDKYIVPATPCVSDILQIIDKLDNA